MQLYIQLPLRLLVFDASCGNLDRLISVPQLRKQKYRSKWYNLCCGSAGKLHKLIGRMITSTKQWEIFTEEDVDRENS
jgi:hypothetical protein